MSSPRSVLIVGGGVIGCALARELAGRRIATTVLERGEPGCEASGAAAGMLAPQSEALPPGPLFDLARASRELFPAWAKELEGETGIDVGFRRTGILRCASAGEEGPFFSRFDWQRRAGLAVEEAGPERIAAISGGLVAGGFRRALFFPEDGVVDPPRLTLALRRAAEARGAEFVTGEARRFRVEGGVCRGVDAEVGELDAEATIDAAGAWAAFDRSAADIPVEPVRGQIVELVPSAVPPAVLWSDEAYLVPRPDGRLLVGSTDERVGFVKDVTARAVGRLIDAACRLVPSLEGARFSSAWAGLRPGSADGSPILGASGIPGLHFAAGHYRNGILLAPATARLLADALEGSESPALAAFSAARFARARRESLT